MTRKKTLVSWSSGKDSAWALHVLRQRADLEIAGLVTTVNVVYQRVAIHAVRVELLQRQAKAAGLPLQVIDLPSPCSNSEYEKAMKEFIDQSKARGIECMAFGDLFLDEIRQYREATLTGTGIAPLFPLWQIPTNDLAKKMISSGLRAVVTCVDPKHLDPGFAGREFNEEFLANLPAAVDPCGERGEFHTFAFDGPMFSAPVDIQLGETVRREGFVYADLVPAAKVSSANLALSVRA